MKKKPGVMVYFELRGMLKLLSAAEKGRLFEALLEYGATGMVEELSDTPKVAWPLIQMRLDMDNTRYEFTVYKRKYAAYTRWAKEHGEEPLEFEAWMAEHGFCCDHAPLPLS